MQTMSAQVRPLLDPSAAKWLRLLGDPCGADLTSPCYGGSGSGYFVRQVRSIAPPSNAVDYLFEFTPTAVSSDIFRFGYSTTAGGSLGTAGAIGIGGLITTDACGRRRCIAACIKVQYLGSELNRSGLVGSVCLPGAELTTSEAINGVSGDWSNSMNSTNRLGSAFEYRWAPGEGDQEWLANSYGDVRYVNATLGNSLQILLRGIPAGSVELQVTTCWEWTPSQEGGAIPWASGAAKAPPSVPFQTVMSAMGDLGRWTAKNVGAGASYMLSTAATTALRHPISALALM